jgi:uncharacterized membrane protein YeaQ/YmgE (transglycosylase-associated protein family)
MLDLLIMGLLFLLILGGILGWLASIISHGESLRGLIQNIGAGVAGAMTAGLLVSPLTGRGSLLADTYSVSALMLSLVGAVLAIAAVNLFLRREVR